MKRAPVAKRPVTADNPKFRPQCEMENQEATGSGGAPGDMGPGGEDEGMTMNGDSEGQSEPTATKVLLGEAVRLLQEIGYKGPLSCEESLLRSSEVGAACQQFTSLCVWLVSELKISCSLVENVSPTEGPEDAETFQLEMSGVVSELYCPYTSLTTGDVTSRLTSLHNCLQLLVFLSTELQAARILNRRKVPAPKSHGKEALQELKLVGEALGMPEPSLAIPVAEFMQMVANKVTEISASLPDSQHLSPLLKIPLQPEQWEKLQELHWSLCREYECRMRMLVTRFDVTVQSFHWSERAKEQGSSMRDVFWPLRQSLTTESGITMSHILAAREEDSRILHTCSARFCHKTSSSIKKVLMLGSVPDRGGRPNEIEPPMPMWEKRREGGGGHHHWGKRSKRRKN